LRKSGIGTYSFSIYGEPATEYTLSLDNGQRGSWNYCKLKRFLSKTGNIWRKPTEGSSY